MWKEEDLKLSKIQPWKDLTFIVIGQVLVSISAILIFVQKILEHRRDAAMLAGSLFVLLGVFQIVRSWRWPQKRYMPSFWCYHIYFWLLTLPLFLSRWLSSESFEDIYIMGISGPSFHRLSEWVFVAMFLLTLVDLVRNYRQEHE